MKPCTDLASRQLEVDQAAAGEAPSLSCVRLPWELNTHFIDLSSPGPPVIAAEQARIGCLRLAGSPKSHSAKTKALNVSP